jgi:hypothetical protein
VKYLLLICIAEGTKVSREEASPDAWVAEMTDRKVRLFGSELRRAGDATSVRLRDGELSITDGPFAEAKEQMAGFDLLECADLDEAIEVASKHPVARFGTLEIRPLVED